MSTFPKRITIDLTKFHQDGLAEIAEHLHLRDSQELVSLVISRGIDEILGSPCLPHACNTNAERIGGTSTKHAFPSRMNMMIDLKSKQDMDELHALEAERDREVARMRHDLGLAETPETASTRRVENYIGIPLTEDLRQALESMVNAHPDLEEENLYAALLELGLTKVQEDPRALGPTKSTQDATMPIRSEEAVREALRAEWRLLCQKVARGWR